MHLNEITKSSDLVYQAKIFHVTKDTAELEDGKLYNGTWYTTAVVSALFR